VRSSSGQERQELLRRIGDIEGSGVWLEEFEGANNGENGANVEWEGCRFGQDSNGDVIIAEVRRWWLNCTCVWTTCTWRIARSRT